MDTAERIAADIALTMNGGEWKDGKWYSKGHREAWIKAVQPYADEIERLRGALRTIDGLIPKTPEITAFPHWGAIAGDIAEGALKGTWPAYGVMPESAKEKE